MSRAYKRPRVKKYGSVESRTKQSMDKIGSAEDGVEYDGPGTLDGNIEPDA